MKKIELLAFKELFTIVVTAYFQSRFPPKKFRMCFFQKRRNNNNHVGIRGKNEVVFGVYDTIFYNRYDKVPKKSVSSVVGVPFFISYLFQAWMCVVKDYRTIEYSEL